MERHKSFVYQEARGADPETKTALQMPIEPRTNGRAICSGCGRAAPGYDRLAERRFEFVPLWQIAVDFGSALRRVKCPTCGVRVEQVPWCDGQQHLTTSDRWCLAGWAQRLSWKGVAEAFDTTWRRGHKSLTLVSQIDAGTKRLLGIGTDRTAQTLLRFFRMLGQERSRKLQFVGSDMWRTYLTVMAQKTAGAIQVLDRFHIMQQMNKAIDEVRAAEAKPLVRDG